MVTAVGDLVLLPGRGFMPARALGTRSNVVVERDGMTFTGAVVPDRDGVRVIFTVIGFTTDLEPGQYGFTMIPDATARVVDDQGREVGPRPRWTTGGNVRFDGAPTLSWTLMLERPRRDAGELTLTFDGPAGDWSVQLPLEPIDHEGASGRSIDVSDHKDGITLAARAIARTAEQIAVELEAYLDPPSTADGWARSYVMGIGATMHSGRLCGDQVVLRDSSGAAHFERGHPIPEDTGGKKREVVLFPTPAAATGEGTVEVDVVWMHQGREEPTFVTVPGEAEITVGGCTGRVAVTRVTPREGEFKQICDPPPESAVHVETTPADPEADRQLVFMSPGENTRVGMTVSHSIGRLPTVDIPEAKERFDSVTFRGGTIQVRGRWRLTIPLA